MGNQCQQWFNILQILALPRRWTIALYLREIIAGYSHMASRQRNLTRLRIADHRIWLNRHAESGDQISSTRPPVMPLQVVLNRIQAYACRQPVVQLIERECSYRRHRLDERHAGQGREFALECLPINSRTITRDRL